MCNDKGGSLPVLESEDDMKLFSADTGYLNVVYLNDTTNHNPYSQEHYIQTFLTNADGTYVPQADVYRSEIGLVKRITFSDMSVSSKCTAFVHIPLLSSWRVVSLPCNIPFNVSLYCSRQAHHKTVQHSQHSTTSTIHIHTAENNFTRIKKGRHCSNEEDSDYHWFQQDETCLHIRKCNYFFETERNCCGLHRPYVFPPGSSMPGAINKTSLVTRFLSLFKAKRTATGKMLGSVADPIVFL